MALVAISSCSSDDLPEVNLVDPELVGVWKAVSLVISNCENEENNSSETNLVCTTFDCIQYTFDDESAFIGKTIVDDRVSFIDGTYSASEGTLTIRFDANTITSGTYAISNNQLVYTYEANGCDIEFTMNKD